MEISVYSRGTEKRAITDTPHATDICAWKDVFHLSISYPLSFAIHEASSSPITSQRLCFSEQQIYIIFARHLNRKPNTQEIHYLYSFKHEKGSPLLTYLDSSAGLSHCNGPLEQIEVF